jgi:hypothetical protein
MRQRKIFTVCVGSYAWEIAIWEHVPHHRYILRMKGPLQRSLRIRSDGHGLDVQLNPRVIIVVTLKMRLIPWSCLIEQRYHEPIAIPPYPPSRLKVFRGRARLTVHYHQAQPIDIDTDREHVGATYYIIRVLAISGSLHTFQNIRELSRGKALHAVLQSSLRSSSIYVGP